MTKSFDRMTVDEYNKLFLKLEEVLDELKNTSRDLKTANEENKYLKEIISKQSKLIEENTLVIKESNDKIASLNNTIKGKDELIEQLKEEITKLKNDNDKDSSNSNRPSGTNGYKKVITNRREKSTKSKGGQKNHKAHFLSTKKLLDEVDKGNILLNVIDINKNEKNKNKKYIVSRVIDILIKPVITEYRIYKNEDGKYDIPEHLKQKRQYGETIKAISLDMMNDIYNSTDSVTRFISSITNGIINLSKGTLINWEKELNDNLDPVLSSIETNLLTGHYINCDDSNIKVNGDNYNIICASNGMYTRLWSSNSKSMKAYDDIGFLKKFFGVIVKDGTSVFNNIEGVKYSQCISHILRYLKGVYDFIDHKAPKEMSELLTEMNNKRNEYIKNGITSFSELEIESYRNRYDSIISKWQIEYDKENGSLINEDERRLLNRMKEKHKEEILYFLYDFKVPSTNNQAEVDQRNVKIKQKIGKFRSSIYSEYYANIRSCINTYKKHGINIIEALKSAFMKKAIIV